MKSARGELRILYLIDEMAALSAGGTERQVLQMIASLAGTGVVPHLCLLRGSRWLTPERAGCPVRYADIRRLASPAGVRDLIRLARWMRGERFQIVQTFFAEANLVGPVLARVAGVPVVIGSRRNLNHWMSSRMRFAQRFSNRLAARLVANCEAVKRCVIEMEGTAPDRVDVLYNAVDTERFAPHPEQRLRMRARLGVNPDEVLIGNVSCLWPVKGVATFVQAAASIRRGSDHCKFLLVGDGPQRPGLEQMAGQLGLDDRFHFAGAQDDVVPFLQACDIGVLCSESEGFSNSLLEYMSVGLACVATDVGGNAEALGGGAGVIVPAGQPELLAESVLALIRDAGRRRTFAAEARARAIEVFSLARARETLARYYLELSKLAGPQLAVREI